MESAMLLATAVCLCLSGAASLARRRLAMGLWAVATALAAAATARLVSLLLASRFDYSYVADHTNRALPVAFKVSALWAGQEGSFLLWLLTMCIAGWAVVRIRSGRQHVVLALYAGVTCCVGLMCYLSRPFAMLAQVPADGAGLTKALQDPWMVVHPPLVFVGYTAMAVLLAFAGALGYADQGGLSRQFYGWMRFAWVFLGLGIFTGSVWAYRALGWGGYWAWDPIENAALVPWLVMCGYLHARTKPGRVRCLVPFILAGAGTFLTRSGILKDLSAHAYTEGSTAFSELMAACLVGAIVYLIVARCAEARPPQGPVEPAGRPLTMFALVTYAYAALIMAGTWAPLLVSYQTPTTFYNAISIAYAIACTALLLAHHAGMLLGRATVVLVANTLVTMGVVGLLHITRYPWLLLLWASLLPLSLYLTAMRRLRGRFCFSHAALSLMMAGAIASSTLGRESLVMSPVLDSRAEVAGRRVLVSDLATKETIAVRTPLADYIIDCKKVVVSEGHLLVPTRSKPLIALFWVGGFALLGSSAWALIRRRA